MIILKIIKIASNTRYSGLKNIFTHKSSIKNSLCGDKIKIELVVNKTKINSMRYEVQSCILCEASASLIAKKMKNYSLKNLKKDIKKLKDNIKNNKFNNFYKFKEYKDLVTKDNTNRINCVTLPLDALLKALKQ
jgi:nitrogen fixation NifU-like protein|tara:strand:- start:144 stop:545 length:402 start_codon:yes stop_codon:yes gene_type:complete